MDLSKQDKVVLSVIRTMREIGLTAISTATALGTNSIHIRGRRNDGVEIIAIVSLEGRTYYGTLD